MLTFSNNFPKLQPTKAGTFLLLEDYYPFTDKSIKIPQNYVTNGADIPRVFWNLIPPFYPKYLPAVVVHDYFCDLEYYKTADTYFELILFEIEKSVSTRAMVYAIKNTINISIKLNIIDI